MERYKSLEAYIDGKFVKEHIMSIQEIIDGKV